MTNEAAVDARRVAKALGWHPTPQPCQCWNCQANRALTTAADEIERLQTLLDENERRNDDMAFLARTS